MADKPVAGSVEPLLDELTREMATSAEPSVDSIMRHDAVTNALTEAATVSLSRALAESSGLDRVLLGSALVPALADALAPALARALMPEIVNILERLDAAESPRKEPVIGRKR
ncbi:hypothetical protein HC031_05135 [Planosporangium thailandense]|uniref:DUF2267 domain-containing protein n=1 Tax=Planosporangium thailandense TaxID=765197 RepID=A0ABX0XV79_9ACTN|nr:hypothetical protein [Planosporangium thailandense]NJC69109.1 hypothetical protein [Planosporangium thailandense]